MKLIGTEKDLEEVLGRIDRVIDAEPGTSEFRELEELSARVEFYESREVSFTAPEPGEALKFRMDQSGMTFGEFAKMMRIKAGKTLRVFCREASLDPGNISRIERGLMSPPAAVEKQDHYAECLGIEKGTEEWDIFHTLASVYAGRIPKRVLENGELMQKLPLIFRVLGNGGDLDKSLRDLAERVRCN